MKKAATHEIATIVAALTKATDTFTTYRVMEFDPRLEPVREQSHKRRAAFQLAKEALIVEVEKHLAAAIKACGEAVDELVVPGTLPVLSAEDGALSHGPEPYEGEPDEEVAPEVFTPGADYRRLAGMPEGLEKRFYDLMEERLPPRLAGEFIALFCAALRRDFVGLERATGQLESLLNVTIGGQAADSK